jgi:hypothetical protein
MKILLLGHGGHGKTSISNLLTEFTGLTCKDSSWAAAEKAVWPFIGHEYPSLQACFDDRRNRRKEWKDYIKDFNTPDLTRLCREILKEADVYVGLRDIDEYRACEHLFDLIIYLDASERKPLEPSMEIPFDPQTMIKLDNNGPMSETAESLIAICREAGLCD